MNKRVLLNCLAIKDSGGISVLEKLLSEIVNSSYDFLICYNKSKNIDSLVKLYETAINFKFIAIESKGYLYRLYYENIVFNNLIKKQNICLVYNFSGSSQFFINVPQITKVHNLLFYCKKINQVYFDKKDYFKWFKEIFIKRILLHRMLEQVKYIEVQSNHVKDYIEDFVDVSKKKFFIKSDIDLKDDTFQKYKGYDFSKKLRFLYIVGPHFESNHKNFREFVQAMIRLKNENFDFEIIITISKEKLNISNFWDKNLNNITCFLGYTSKKELSNEFQANTILISTSVIESLGLHVIEAIQNGILAIVPNEKYSLDVYGNDILKYDLYNVNSLVNTINSIYLKDYNFLKKILLKNQKYLIKNESKKYPNVIEIFNKIIKENCHA